MTIARLHGGADVQLSSFSRSDLSTYFGITGRRDYRGVVSHLHEAHVDEDSEVIRADREYFRALAFYVMQRPAKSNSVLELKIGKACLWFRHVRAQSEEPDRRKYTRGDPKGDRLLTRFLLGLGFLSRGRRPGGLPRQPLGLEPLAIGMECLLCNFVLSHCLFGIDFAKCLMRIALRFSDWLGWFKLARRLCHFFTLGPSYRRRMACLEAAHDPGVEIRWASFVPSSVEIWRGL